MSRLEFDLVCLPADCDSTLKDRESALIAIAHAIDNLGAAFSDDSGEPSTGSATVNLYRLADAAERTATALETIAAAMPKQPTAGSGCQCSSKTTQKGE
jgi:hypothetical protein